MPPDQVMLAKLSKWVVPVFIAVLFGCGGSDERGAGGDKKPRTVEQWVGLSRAYMEKYYDTDDVVMTARAALAAREAVDIDSTASAVVQLATVRTAEKQYQEASTLLGSVIRANPSDGESWGLLGDALFEWGKYRNADSSYYVMYEMDEGFDSLRRIAGRAAVFESFEEALGYLDRAIAGAAQWEVSERDLGKAYAELAELFFTHGYLDAALTNIDRSLELLPEPVPNLLIKADILRVMGQTLESTEIYRRLVDLSPHPHYKSLLARAYADRGDVAAADSLVKVALDEYDRLSLKYFDIIARSYTECLLDWGVDPERGLTLAYGQSRKQRDIYSYELLAWAYYKNQQYDLAWSSVSLALRTGAKDPRIVYRASVIAKAAGKKEKYDIFFRRAEDLNPMGKATWRD